MLQCLAGQTKEAGSGQRIVVKLARGRKKRCAASCTCEVLLSAGEALHLLGTGSSAALECAQDPVAVRGNLSLVVGLILEIVCVRGLIRLFISLLNPPLCNDIAKLVLLIEEL